MLQPSMEHYVDYYSVLLEDPQTLWKKMCGKNNFYFTTAGNTRSLSFKLNPKHPSKKISIPCLTIYNGKMVKANAVLL